MLSYRHAYHAGNHADVLKHFVLCRILQYLTRKEKALRYIDTHAGIGLYSLAASDTARLQEYRTGVLPLLLAARSEPGAVPEAARDYLALVETCNPKKDNSSLHLYPGSPWLARELLRPQDRIELCELHPKDYPRLQRHMGRHPKLRCHFEDGFATSLALMPPVEKRGLVLIDPSYEIKSDYARVGHHVRDLLKRFATGTVAVWYPVLQGNPAAQLQRLLTGLQQTVVISELHVAAPGSGGMTGSGMLVVNPPWTLEEETRQFLAYATPLLAGDDGDWSIREL